MLGSTTASYASPYLTAGTDQSFTKARGPKDQGDDESGPQPAKNEDVRSRQNGDGKRLSLAEEEKDASRDRGCHGACGSLYTGCGGCFAGNANAGIRQAGNCRRKTGFKCSKGIQTLVVRSVGGRSPLRPHPAPAFSDAEDIVPPGARTEYCIPHLPELQGHELASFVGATARLVPFWLGM